MRPRLGDARPLHADVEEAGPSARRTRRRRVPVGARRELAQADAVGHPVEHAVLLQRRRRAPSARGSSRGGGEPSASCGVCVDRRLAVGQAGRAPTRGAGRRRAGGCRRSKCSAPYVRRKGPFSITNSPCIIGTCTCIWLGPIRSVLTAGPLVSPGRRMRRRRLQRVGQVGHAERRRGRAGTAPADARRGRAGRRGRLVRRPRPVAATRARGRRRRRCPSRGRCACARRRARAACAGRCVCVAMRCSKKASIQLVYAMRCMRSGP